MSFTVSAVSCVLPGKAHEIPAQSSLSAFSRRQGALAFVGEVLGSLAGALVDATQSPLATEDSEEEEDSQHGPFQEMGRGLIGKVLAEGGTCRDLVQSLEKHLERLERASSRNL